MREVVFRVLAERPGHLEAQAETLPIRVIIQQGNRHVDVEQGLGRQNPAASQTGSICSLLTTWPD